jgi:hypothetical protein
VDGGYWRSVRCCKVSLPNVMEWTNEGSESAIVGSGGRAQVLFTAVVG